LYRDTRVQFVGFVEDMKTALQEYDIFVCAIVAGSGVKNKILQASMAGLPIASTTLGIEGVAPAIRDAVLVGDTPEELARAILDLDIMTEELLRARFARAKNHSKRQQQCFRASGVSCASLAFHKLGCVDFINIRASMRLTKRSRSRGLFFLFIEYGYDRVDFNVMNYGGVFLAFCVVVYMQVRVFMSCAHGVWVSRRADAHVCE
jgi:hypothetical protein